MKELKDKIKEVDLMISQISNTLNKEGIELYKEGYTKGYQDCFNNNNRWRKTSEEHPASLFKDRCVLDEFLNPSDDNQVLCLTRSKKYGIKLLAYNKYYNIWDNEDLDDYCCEIEDIEEWKPIK